MYVEQTRACAVLNCSHLAHAHAHRIKTKRLISSVQAMSKPIPVKCFTRSIKPLTLAAPILCCASQMLLLRPHHTSPRLSRSLSIATVISSIVQLILVSSSSSLVIASTLEPAHSSAWINDSTRPQPEILIDCRRHGRGRQQPAAVVGAARRSSARCSPLRAIPHSRLRPCCGSGCVLFLGAE